MPIGQHKLKDQKKQLVSFRYFDEEGKLLRKVGVRNIIEESIYYQLDEPINEFVPNEKRSLIRQHLQSKDLDGRWYKAINQEDKICNVYEGYTNADGITIFSNGFYFGQMQNGQREGYGQLYTTDLNNIPHLFDCEWVQGLPTRGRLYFEKDEEVHFREGIFENMLIKHEESTEIKIEQSNASPTE
ncbi:hypothetical protein FGO68_gene16811 [Halteria grandinella]|uniref:MORN repeat protein n=1 Tax=Halteria grandinella TaxID=5974 RepID=A0A8J8T4W8_HALGN|nr:hypothetical protein FGO68_gene16811 [Halteria grandinella]